MNSSYMQIHFLVIGIICGITTSTAECPSDRAKRWSYDDNLPNGPSHWYKRDPDCNGKRQSPINIVTNEVISDPQTLQVKNYDKPLKQLKIDNDGHKINVHPTDGVNRTLTFNGTEYPLKSIHFHVGSSSNKGSEHAIDGQRFAVECHFEHKTEDGHSLTLSSLIQEGQINYSLDVMLSVSSSYTFEGEYFQGSVSRSDSSNPRPERTMIYLDDLVQVDGAYYHYAGSLEYPPCTENKYWLILKPHKQVASSQLQQLFGLYRARRNATHLSQCHLINNYRPINPTNGRPVYGERWL